MCHVFSSLCLKINRYSHDRQGERRGDLPTVCCWLVLQRLDTDSCQVTCGHRQVWLDLGISEGANIQFLQQPDSPRVYTEDAPVTLWCPLTDGTPCRCFGICLLATLLRRRSSQDWGPWTTLLSMRLDGPSLHPRCPVFVQHFNASSAILTGNPQHSCWQVGKCYLYFIDKNLRTDTYMVFPRSVSRCNRGSYTQGINSPARALDSPA